MKFYLLCLVVLAVGCTRTKSNSAQNLGHNHTEGQTRDVKTEHGWLLFGKDKIFGEHIPMIAGSPHDYQVIVDFTLFSKIAEDVYKKHNKGMEQNLMSLKSTPFQLPNFMKDANASFESTLYVGNHEQGGQRVNGLGKVNAIKNKLLYGEKLPLREPSRDLTYFYLSDGARQFLIHKLTVAPGFQQILQVSTAAQLENMTEVVVVEREDLWTKKLNHGEEVETSAGDFQVLSEVSCLLGPKFLDPCR